MRVKSDVERKIVQIEDMQTLNSVLRDENYIIPGGVCFFVSGLKPI